VRCFPSRGAATRWIARDGPQCWSASRFALLLKLAPRAPLHASSGNVIIACAALTVHDNVLTRLVAVAVFMGGAALAGVLGTLCRLGHSASPRQIALVLLALEAIFLAAAWAVGAAVGVPSGDGRSTTEWQVIVIVTFLALSMGTQNGTTRECRAFATFPPTTAMTATVASLGNAAARLLILLPVLCVPSLAAGAAESTAQLRKEVSSNVDQFSKFGPTMAAFLVGAAVGAACQFYFGWHSISVPLGVLLLLMADLVAAEVGVTVPVRQGVAHVAAAVRSTLASARKDSPPLPAVAVATPAAASSSQSAVS
jgi:hypothetical protein